MKRKYLKMSLIGLILLLLAAFYKAETYRYDQTFEVTINTDTADAPTISNVRYSSDGMEGRDVSFSVTRSRRDGASFTFDLDVYNIADGGFVWITADDYCGYIEIAYDDTNGWPTAVSQDMKAGECGKETIPANTIPGNVNDKLKSDSWVTESTPGLKGLYAQKDQAVKSIINQLTFPDGTTYEVCDKNQHCDAGEECLAVNISSNDTDSATQRKVSEVVPNGVNSDGTIILQIEDSWEFTKTAGGNGLQGTVYCECHDPDA